jgi:hypothetical protein
MDTFSEFATVGGQACHVLMVKLFLFQLVM